LYVNNASRGKNIDMNTYSTQIMHEIQSATTLLEKNERRHTVEIPSV